MNDSSHYKKNVVKEIKLCGKYNINYKQRNCKPNCKQQIGKYSCTPKKVIGFSIAPPTNELLTFQLANLPMKTSSDDNKVLTIGNDNCREIGWSKISNVICNDVPLSECDENDNFIITSDENCNLKRINIPCTQLVDIFQNYNIDFSFIGNQHFQKTGDDVNVLSHDNYHYVISSGLTILTNPSPVLNGEISFLNGTFKPEKSGKYLWNINLIIGSESNFGIYGLSICEDDDQLRTTIKQCNPNIDINTSLDLTALLNLSAHKTYNIKFYHNSSTTSTIVNGYISITKLP